VKRGKTSTPLVVVSILVALALAFMTGCSSDTSSDSLSASDVADQLKLAPFFRALARPTPAGEPDFHFRLWQVYYQERVVPLGPAEVPPARQVFDELASRCP
jgi:hypothetical protein